MLLRTIIIKWREVNFIARQERLRFSSAQRRNLPLCLRPMARVRANRRSITGVAMAALLLCSGLAACVNKAERPRAHRSTPLPASSLPASGSAENRQCLARLDAAGVRYAPLRDEAKGGGCAIRGAVQLMDIGVSVSNLGPMSCSVAQPFAAWARFAVQPAARLYLGSEVVQIETFGTYSCRNVRGAGGPARLSEHSQANAVDVSAFVLADGRRISVLDDWRTEGPVRQFLSAIHMSACRRFKTVLSPDYNVAHRDHFHFDMGGRGGFCR
jgi:hypothetical protein